MADSEPAKYPVTLVNRGWPPLIAGSVIALILATWLLLPDQFAFALLTVPPLYGLSLGLRYLLVLHYELSIEGNWLIERDSKGREIGRLNLTLPFNVEYIFKGSYNALYLLRQGKTRLRFGAQTRGAPYIVKEILQLQWPPLGQGFR